MNLGPELVLASYDNLHLIISGVGNEDRKEIIEGLKLRVKAYDEKMPEKVLGQMPYYPDYARFCRKHLTDTILFLECLNDLRSSFEGIDDE